MNKTERIKMVKAMEYIAQQINDVLVSDRWLLCGIANGELEYGDLTADPGDESVLNYIEDDTRFAELMGVFLDCMARAHESKGLLCDGVLDQHTQNAE